jgi:hypothetical protein
MTVSIDILTGKKSVTLAHFEGDWKYLPGALREPGGPWRAVVIFVKVGLGVGIYLSLLR